VARFQVRLSDEALARWREAARTDGVDLSEFVRRSVEERVAGRTTRTIARAVADLLAPELERMISDTFARPNVGDAAQFETMTTTFDRGCIDADLHRQGAVCPSCGGSTH